MELNRQTNGLTLASPAKVNLFLRILRKREDGYHQLASLFQTVDLCDTLYVKLADNDRLTSKSEDVPMNSDNLIVQAAHLFRHKTGLQVGVEVHLVKRIPLRAGLGGGSSNAATTLWALNQLCGKPATDQQLAAWAAELGSDIAFFFSGGTAYCTGRGEVISPCPSPSIDTSLWVVKPKEGLETPDVYRRVDASSLPQRDPEECLSRCLGGDPLFFNDLEPAAFSAMPELAGLKQRLLKCGFPHVFMSGSGSAMICLGEGDPPLFPRHELYPTRFLHRQLDQWYHALPMHD